jgi:hypothetical protein
VGQVYYDIDTNNLFSPPPQGKDKPIARKRIYLVDLGRTPARGRQAPLGSTVTDASGNFRLIFQVQNSKINGGITLNLGSNELIATVQILPGSNQKEIPLLQPVKV